MARGGLTKKDDIDVPEIHSECLMTAFFKRLTERMTNGDRKIEAA